MLCILVVSIASRSVSGGRIDGIRFAIIDFPEPGGPSSSLVCSPARAGNGTQPILENHAVGPFLEVRAGEIYGPTSDRRNYQARLRGRGDRAFVESCRFDERAAVVVATVFGRRGNLRLRFPGSVRADSAYE